MQGNIVYVDYERSSWRYMSYERNYKSEDLDAFKIGETYRPERDTIEPYLIGGTYKGGGSAYGGAWKTYDVMPWSSLLSRQCGNIVFY